MQGISNGVYEQSRTNRLVSLSSIFMALHVVRRGCDIRTPNHKRFEAVLQQRLVTHVVAQQTDAAAVIAHEKYIID
jgi:hypothetical protein